MQGRQHLLETLSLISPGTPLREGLDNILRAKTGALIVFADTPQVFDLVEGGFTIDTDFRPSALYELAKMDGAIVLTDWGKRILKANAHLTPQFGTISQETGIRHRIAERVARQTGTRVVAISQRRKVITLYQGNFKHVLRDIGFILTKANQAIQTMEKNREVLLNLLDDLGLMEFEDSVTATDVLRVLQRAEMVRRMVEEIEFYICELGQEGRMVKMHLDELTARLKQEFELVVADYVKREPVDGIMTSLNALSQDELVDLASFSKAVASWIGMGIEPVVTPRGYRLLTKLPKLPAAVMDNLVRKFGDFSNIYKASIEELDQVEGIGETRAKVIREGLRRLRDNLLIQTRR